MVLLCMIMFGIALGITIIFDLSVIYPLLFGVICFFVAAISRGFHAREVGKMMLRSMKTSLVVIGVFAFIGLITGAWRASGTIPYFVYLGIKFISPQWFVLFAFLITCVISFLLGTAFGTVGTIGTVMMVLSSLGNVNPIITAGAVVSGAFFGDRCAPTSSSAILVSVLSNTDLFKNIKNMMKSALVPFLITCIIYGILSIKNPLQVANGSLASDIASNFKLGIITLVPAIIILVLPLFKIKIKICILVSAITAAIIAVVVQGHSFGEIIHTMILGYSPKFQGWFSGIIAGGGLISMLKSTVIVLIASTYAGVIEGTDIFSGVDKIIMNVALKLGAYITTLIVSLVAALISCNQALAIMLTHQFTARVAENLKVSKEQQALNVENSAVLVSSLIPWNIASSVPLSMMGVGAGAILYSCYLYVLPICCVILELKKCKHNRE